MLRRLVTAALLVVASVAVGQSLISESPDGPKGWITDYALARQEAERLGLPIVVHFHASWCGPCAQMERETLNSPEVVRQLGTSFIGLKVDHDEAPELVKGFKVESLPSDFIVAPSGRIVYRRSGYQPRQTYLASLGNWSGAFAKERTEALARLQPQPQPTAPQLSFNPPRRPMNQPQVAQATTLKPETSVPQQPTSVPVTTATSEKLLMGLDGFSPVAIKDKRQWIEGRREFAMNYQGVAFLMADAVEYRLFQENPERYAPRFLGCDPVQLLESKQAVPGSVEWGAFFGGELYLFQTLQSRNQFKLDPDRYTKARQIVRVDEIMTTRLR